MSPSYPISDNTWMSRCFDLAKRGVGSVSPNPPVGAVLVYEDKIISEGYHPFFGGPHAEVETIKNVPPDLRHLIPLSTLYVSLEPCCVTGKTPPCTNLIIQEGIKDVRISTQDPNPNVSGQGIEILRSHGISVTKGILEEEGKQLIRTFTTNILQRRPHIILKWAQSRFGYSGIRGAQVWLSKPHTKIWTHGQRAEVDVILVGARTVESDNPSLTVREATGRSPHRAVFDPNGKLASHYSVFNEDQCKVFYFSNTVNPHIKGLNIHKTVLQSNSDVVSQMLEVLFENNIGSILVEGGPYLHNLFVGQNMWDEAWVIQTQNQLDHGYIAPNVKGRLIQKIEIETDTIIGIRNTQLTD